MDLKSELIPMGNHSMTMKNGNPLSKSGANAHVHKYVPWKNISE